MHSEVAKAMLSPGLHAPHRSLVLLYLHCLSESSRVNLMVSVEEGHLTLDMALQHTD